MDIIFNILGVSIWFGKTPAIKNTLIPSVSWYNGGCYWKFYILWLKYLLELSGPKKDNTVYRKVTSEELDEILKELK